MRLRVCVPHQLVELHMSFEVGQAAEDVWKLAAGAALVAVNRGGVAKQHPGALQSLCQLRLQLLIWWLRSARMVSTVEWACERRTKHT